ncbi:hypothetical protein TcasGA2_TC002256 [Tribolium castaneum]|uniref:Uncharacterized protein n=1 Tax=Tribolium castaneum TaxID=7070 RepID=D7EHV1_TRICA|nr:hypothetical protein TcasGA2_TC002256 [Tribolium castaneum]
MKTSNARLLERLRKMCKRRNSLPKKKTTTRKKTKKKSD